jgi:hypothetical protein
VLFDKRQAANFFTKLAFVLLTFGLPSCYFVDHFRRVRGEGEAANLDNEEGDVLGQSLGPKAGARNQSALDSVWAVSTTHAPAAVRPDPDMMARRILKQFKPEGTTLARVTGDVENYRQLLGGAPADFITFPADGYDATSVLANIKVAEELCTALIAPSSWRHQGWTTILPYDVGNKRTNLTWLLQRFTGIYSTNLSSSSVDRLVTLFDQNNTDGVVTTDDYVAPCMAVMIDAQSLLF